MLLAACSVSGLEIVSVGYNPAHQSLEVNPASCNASYETALDATADEVRITLTQAEPGEPGNECLDAVVVELDEPLQHRRVIVNGDQRDVNQSDTPSSEKS